MKTDPSPGAAEGMLEGYPSDKAVTIEDYAKIEFEAWRNMQEAVRPPSNNGWVNDGEIHLPVVRLAWTTMFRTKAELIEAFNAHPNELVGLVDGIRKSLSYFRPFLDVLESAELRLLIAASAAAEEEGK